MLGKSELIAGRSALPPPPPYAEALARRGLAALAPGGEAADLIQPGQLLQFARKGRIEA